MIQTTTRVCAALVAALIAISPAIAQTTLYVRTSGNDRNTGVSPDRALRTIQAAVSKVDGPGYVIYVGPGPYTEEVRIGSGRGRRSASGELVRPNMFSGDSAGIHTGDEPGEVIISGGGSRNTGLYIDGADHWEVRNLSFRRQKKNAVQVQQASRPVIRDCIIETPLQYGVYVVHGNGLVIDGCRFIRNQTSGHVIYFYGGGTDDLAVRVENNSLAMAGELYLSTGFRDGRTGLSRNNYAADAYGVILMQLNNYTPLESWVRNNTISDCFVGIYAYTYHPRSRIAIANNTITGSCFPVYAIGLANQPCDLSNTLVSECYYGPFVYAPSQGRVEGTLMHNVRYALRSIGKRLADPITGVDPLLADPAAGDWTLAAGSPAIDSGTALNAPSRDIRGRLRPTDGDDDARPDYDIGATENIPGAGEEEEPAAVRVVRWREVSPRDGED